MVPFTVHGPWKVKGSYERLEGVNRSYPILLLFKVKARQKGKFSRCATK
jgi:hypothetical protein